MIDERQETIDVIILHTFLKLIESGSHIFPFIAHVGKVFLINLCERHSFYLIFQVWNLRMVATCLASPIDGILCLSVKHHAVKVE